MAQRTLSDHNTTLRSRLADSEQRERLMERVMEHAINKPFFGGSGASNAASINLMPGMERSGSPINSMGSGTATPSAAASAAAAAAGAAAAAAAAAAAYDPFDYTQPALPTPSNVSATGKPPGSPSLPPSAARPVPSLTQPPQQQMVSGSPQLSSRLIAGSPPQAMVLQGAVAPPGSTGGLRAGSSSNTNGGMIVSSGGSVGSAAPVAGGLSAAIAAARKNNAGAGGASTLSAPSASTSSAVSSGVSATLPTPHTPHSTHHHSSASHMHEHLLLIGGISNATTTLDTIESYDPLTSQWRHSWATMHCKRWAPGVCASGGKVFAMGGRSFPPFSPVKRKGVSRGVQRLSLF